MPQEGEVSWRRFYVHAAGKTNGAHLSLVKDLKGIGQIQVESSDDCEYVLVICPAVSRVGTNISEALDSMPVDKPAILVVMHHTFNSNQVVADSRRQVNNPNVRLTVDVLFHEGKLLRNCNRNEIAWFEIKRFLQGAGCQVPGWSLWNRIPCPNWGNNDRNQWIVCAVVGVVLVTLVITLAVYVNRNRD